MRGKWLGLIPLARRHVLLSAVIRPRGEAFMKREEKWREGVGER